MRPSPPPQSARWPLLLLGITMLTLLLLTLLSLAQPAAISPAVGAMG